MAAVSRMSNPERVVITAVLAGVLRIDDQGRVWRNTKRGEVRWRDSETCYRQRRITAKPLQDQRLGVSN